MGLEGNQRMANSGADDADDGERKFRAPFWVGRELQHAHAVASSAAGSLAWHGSFKPYRFRSLKTGTAACATPEKRFDYVRNGLGYKPI